jgi:hypothetical protein
MDQAEQAVRAFESTNASQYERSPRAVHWLIPHLIYAFNINNYLRGMRRHLRRLNYTAARQYVLKKLVSSYVQETEHPLDREQFDMAIFYFEGYFVWFLEYEKRMRAQGNNPWQRKAQWRRLRYVFRYG